MLGLRIFNKGTGLFVNVRQIIQSKVFIGFKTSLEETFKYNTGVNSFMHCLIPPPNHSVHQRFKT